MKKSQYHDLREVCLQINVDIPTTETILRKLTDDQKEYFEKFIGFWLNQGKSLDRAGFSSKTGIRYKID